MSCDSISKESPRVRRLGRFGVPPDRFVAAPVAFISPRTLWQTHTSHGLEPTHGGITADDRALDLGTRVDRGRLITLGSRRCALSCVAVGVYFARSYGLISHEPSFFVDCKNADGADYRSGFLRVLREGELREFGDYRTRRLLSQARNAPKARGRR
jgi:hypothetical protein